jgi:hypothetical protein
MIMNKVLSIIVLFILIVGCAGVTTELVPDDKDKEANGIRYYQAVPFLLVHTDNEGGLTTELLYLPDLTQKFSIKPYNFLAKNDTTLTFTNGMLDQSTNIIDTTVIPKAVISSLEKVAVAAVNAAFNTGAPPDSTQVPPPYLFKVVRTNGEWKLLGGPGKDASGKDMVINVTISKPTE